MSLEKYFPVAEAMARLLHPHGETVVHDLETGKIAAIYHNLSKRKVGDESLIEMLADYAKLPDVFPVYEKMNWDGRKMRSTSATLRDDLGNAVGLLCINLDVSQWEEFRHVLNQWLNGSSAQAKPEVLFKDDWREKINQYVTEHLKKEGTSLKLLTKEGKYELIKVLYREGAFKAKNGAVYVADVLDLSRSTIYNYLRIINEHNPL